MDIILNGTIPNGHNLEWTQSQWALSYLNVKYIGLVKTHLHNDTFNEKLIFCVPVM